MLAILIVAHNNPVHFKHLIRSLHSARVHIFVHIDRKSFIDEFLIYDQTNVTFIRNRINVNWGGWSQVQATLNLIRLALSDSRNFTNFALISGTDYPIANVERLCDFVLGEKEFINSVSFPCDRLGKSFTRVSRFFLEGGERSKGYRARLLKIINRWANNFLSERSIDYLPGPLYAGSSWWILTRSAVEYADNAGKRGKPLRKLLRYSLCPDEIFFQTVVAWAKPNESTRPALTYADWSAAQSGPSEIKGYHLAALKDGNFLIDMGYGSATAYFIRKFSDDHFALRAEVDMIAAHRAFSQ